MESGNAYENLYFNGMLNVIQADSFPRSFPFHWHKYVEIIALPREAKISRLPLLRVNQTAYPLRPGDLILIWPGEVHETVENTDGQLIGLQFSASVFNELPDFAPFIHIFRTFHHISWQDMPELAQRMQTHFQQMCAVQKKQETFSGVEMVICLYEMFIDFGTYIKHTILNDSRQVAAGAGRTLEKVSSACSYIMENCDRELTLESAASYAGFSTCYFSRIFKKVTSYNFVEYLTLQRIKRAQLLLADSDITITEISYQSGFKSISTFNRVFRQYRGCSPSEYRKYYLK